MRAGRPRLSRRAAVRWIAAVMALAVSGGIALAMAPANASSSTVRAQLSLSGVATQSNVLGGTTVGIHPGDTVDFQASALPTAGLDNIPTIGPALDKALVTLLGAQFEVVLTVGSSFPGGTHTVTIGGKGHCAGVPDLPITFPAAGTYTFSWTVKYVLPGLLGCTANGVSDTSLNLLKKAGVALNATNQWVGAIVVATNPPAGGISIQLPGVSIAPNIAGHQLPAVGLPGIALPTIPIDIPNLGNGLPKLPGAGGAGGLGGGNCVPCAVVPNTGLGPVGGSLGDSANQSGLGSVGTGVAANVPANVAANAPANVPAAGNSAKTAANVPIIATKEVTLAANKSSSGQLPVILALLAIIGLAVVTATYARLFLFRRD
jgi:hypothetical protein